MFPDTKLAIKVELWSFFWCFFVFCVCFFVFVLLLLLLLLLLLFFFYFFFLVFKQKTSSRYSLYPNKRLSK